MHVSLCVSGCLYVLLLCFPPIACPFLSFPFLSFPCLALPFLSFPFLSFPYLSFPFLSFPVLSFPCLAFPFLSFLPLPDDSAAEGRDARDMVCFDVDAQCAWRSQSPAVALNERVGATKMALSPPMPQGPMEEKFQHEYRSICLDCSKWCVTKNFVNT